MKLYLPIIPKSQPIGIFFGTFTSKIYSIRNKISNFHGLVRFILNFDLLITLENKFLFYKVRWFFFFNSSEHPLIRVLIPIIITKKNYIKSPE